MPGGYDPGAAILLESKPRLEPAMVRFFPVVGIPVGATPGRWQEIINGQRVGRRSVGHHLEGITLMVPMARSTNRRAGRAGPPQPPVGEPQHPPLDADVVDLNAALGEHLLDIAVGEPAAQIPADRECNDVRREAEAGEHGSRRDRRTGVGRWSSWRESRRSAALSANTTTPVQDRKST